MNDTCIYDRWEDCSHDCPNCPRCTDNEPDPDEMRDNFNDREW